MKPLEKAVILLAIFIAWIYLFGCFGSSKSDSFGSEAVNYILAGFVLSVPFILPALGYFLVRNQRRTLFYKVFYFPMFILSLVPVAIFLFLFSVRLFVSAPK